MYISCNGGYGTLPNHTVLPKKKVNLITRFCRQCYERWHVNAKGKALLVYAMET